MPRHDDFLDRIIGYTLHALILGGFLYASVRYAVDARYTPVAIMRCVGQATCNAGGKP